MAEQRKEEKNRASQEEEEEEEKENVDPELFSCLLQPLTADYDLQYVGIRRLLLFRKAESGVLHRRVGSSIFATFELI